MVVGVGVGLEGCGGPSEVEGGFRTAMTGTGKCEYTCRQVLSRDVLALRMWWARYAMHREGGQFTGRLYIKVAGVRSFA